MTIQQELSLQEELGGLRERLERGDVEGGRTMVDRLVRQYPDSEDVRYFARVLARPRGVLRPDAPLVSLERERAWLRAHAHEHRGCWLAVSGNALVAVDPDYATVMARVRETVGVENVVLYFQP